MQWSNGTEEFKEIRISPKGGEEGERWIIYRKQDFVVLQEG